MLCGKAIAQTISERFGRVVQSTFCRRFQIKNRRPWDIIRFAEPWHRAQWLPWVERHALAVEPGSDWVLLEPFPVFPHGDVVRLAESRTAVAERVFQSP